MKKLPPAEKWLPLRKWNGDSPALADRGRDPLLVSRSVTARLNSAKLDLPIRPYCQLLAIHTVDCRSDDCHRFRPTGTAIDVHVYRHDVGPNTFFLFPRLDGDFVLYTNSSSGESPSLQRSVLGFPYA